MTEIMAHLTCPSRKIPNEKQPFWFRPCTVYKSLSVYLQDDNLINLIKGCKKNKRKSQEGLYQAFYAYGMSVALRYTESPDEAKEVLNDSFMKVFQHIKTFDPTRPFRAWLRRIVINTSINHYKKHQKHQNHTDINGVELILTRQDAVEELTYQELIALIQKSLSPAYRTVFCLYAIDGYHHEEIAKMLEISVGASKSNLARARAKLKEVLKQNDFNYYEKLVR